MTFLYIKSITTYQLHYIVITIFYSRLKKLTFEKLIHNSMFSLLLKVYT